jgi:hypothetical protein
MQMLKESFCHVRAGFRRLGAQVIEQQLAAMAGRQLVEFLASFRMLLEYGGEVSGHGNFSRCAVELEGDTDYIADIRTACFTQRSIDLQAVAAGARGNQRRADGAVIYSGDDGDVFRLRVLLFFGRRCVLAALELLDQGIGDIRWHIHVPHYPNPINRRQEFLWLRHHRSRTPSRIALALRTTLCVKRLRSSIPKGSRKMAPAIFVARGFRRERNPEP